MKMMTLLVSPQQWANWDQWYNYTLPGYVLILGTIFLFVGLIPFLCVKNKLTAVLFGLTTTTPVSYTHLDVYKRQVLMFPMKILKRLFQLLKSRP